MVFSIAVDTLHAIKSGSKKNQVSPERYYYTTTNQLFEQSLDIYRPPPSSHSPSSSMPVVTLVVGSAWLGHRSCIYSGCSWWNSSGPKTVAKLGCVCVCIRHRGAFPRTFSPLSILFVAIMAGVFVTLLHSFIGTDGWRYVEEMFATHVGVGVAAVPLGRTRAFLLTFFMGLVAMELAGHGSASFDQMQNDVMDALVYLEKNKKRLGLNISSDDAQFIFGGYSSGGHVAATITQQPHLWKERNLPSPDVYCDSLLYISPVLSTKPYAEMCRKLSSLSSSSLSMMSPSSSMPSLAPSEGSQSSNDQNAAARRALEKTSSSISSSTLSSLQSTSSPPKWLTSELVKAIFGHAAAQTPSPIHTYSKSPSLPHTFVGCEKEMFGLNWLDLFFCSPTYCELLKSMGIDSRYVAVDSDHWNILNSTVLSEALEEEIKLVQMRRHSGKSSRKNKN
jgi:hypothetical protein